MMSLYFFYWPDRPNVNGPDFEMFPQRQRMGFVYPHIVTLRDILTDVLDIWQN